MITKSSFTFRRYKHKDPYLETWVAYLKAKERICAAELSSSHVANHMMEDMANGIINELYGDIRDKIGDACAGARTLASTYPNSVMARYHAQKLERLYKELCEKLF